MLYPSIPIGDYCRGLANGVITFFLGVVLILFNVIIYIIYIFRYFKTKKTIDIIPLVLTIIFMISCFYFIKLNDKKSWTKEVYRGYINVEKEIHNSDNRLILYKNNSFAITRYHIDYSCTYQGSYELQNGYLRLKRNDLSEITKNLFFTEYKLNSIDSTFYPTNKEYYPIKLLK